MLSKAFRSFTALLLLITGCKARQVWHTEEEYYRLPRWDEYVARFENMNYAPHTTTLFVGDSMTEGFDLKRHFKQVDLRNKGPAQRLEVGCLVRDLRKRE